MYQCNKYRLIGLSVIALVVPLNAQASLASAQQVGDKNSTPLVQSSNAGIQPVASQGALPASVQAGMAPVAQMAPAAVPPKPLVPTVVQPVVVPVANPKPVAPQGSQQSSPIKPQMPAMDRMINQAPTVQAPMTAQPASQPLVTPSPAPFNKVPVKIPEVEKEEPQGIDTVNAADAQGNWLFKRMWWQRAETQYEKIKGVVEAIMESRMAFFAKRTEWDKTIFDPFYLDSGLGRGVLEELISSLINQLNQERAHEGQLDEKERELLAALESQKAVLEQLQKDVQKINDIDNAVDEAISVLIKQINTARNFEKQSWQNFKAIAQELNDKKARDLYYGMVTYWQNINEIGQYIQMPFLQHFENLGAMAKDQIEKVSGTLKALKEKGIDFKKQWQQLEENNMRQRQAHEFKEGVEEGKKEAEAEKAAEQGFFASMLSTFSNGISSVWNYAKSAGVAVWDFTLGRFFTKKAEVVDQADDKDHSASHESQIPAPEQQMSPVSAEANETPVQPVREQTVPSVD